MVRVRNIYSPCMFLDQEVRLAIRELKFQLPGGS